MNEDILKKISDQIKKTQTTKDRNTLIIQAKQNMLMVALMNKASAKEIEAARQELIDASIASIDAAIESYRESMRVLEI